MACFEWHLEDTEFTFPELEFAFRELEGVEWPALEWAFPDYDLSGDTENV